MSLLRPICGFFPLPHHHAPLVGVELVRDRDHVAGHAVPSTGQRIAIANLDLGDAQIKKCMRHGRAFVSIKNVCVTLNATAMGAANATFGTALPESVELGAANVLARVVH
jgi:hypothetical protein